MLSNVTESIHTCEVLCYTISIVKEEPMFQSAISCKEYSQFVEVARVSEEEAQKILIRYTNTTQNLLQEVINHFHHGGKLPQTSFSTRECELQEAIARGEFKQIFDDGHHKTGHF